jgi:hypothetical protein
VPKIDSFARRAIRVGSLDADADRATRRARGAGLGDATDATNARALRRFSEDANARNDGGVARRAR